VDRLKVAVLDYSAVKKVYSCRVSEGLDRLDYQ
jgi:hypothetical protein